MRFINKLFGSEDKKDLDREQSFNIATRDKNESSIITQKAHHGRVSVWGRNYRSSIESQSSSSNSF